ncbi:sigma 54-interacting transcriptional regulator [Niallia circulans]
MLRTTFQSSGQYIVCTIDKYICALPKNLQQKYQNWIGTSLSRFAQETGAVSAVHIPIMHHHRLIGYRIPLRAETSFVWNGSRGLSKSYKQVLESIKNVAPTDTTVHLVGETGVGKKFLASCIHENSPKSTAPFYKLHCSMLTKDILQRFLSTDLQRLTKKRHQVVEEATIFWKRLENFRFPPSKCF